MVLQTWEWVALIALVFVFLLSSGITTFIMMSRLRWPFRVNVLQDVDGSGKLKVVRTDRARTISFGDGGEEIFFLKRGKKYRVGYGKRIGNNLIAWAIGQDGYWYNVTLEGIDKKLLEIGVIPVDKDMRFATASLRKGIENRYNDKSWIEKYAPLVYASLFIVILVLFAGIIWFSFNKQIQVANINLESTKSQLEVQQLSKDTLNAIANLRSSPIGSGLTPAPVIPTAT